MQVTTEEILHMAELADLKLREDEIEKSKVNLQDILNFAEIINNAPISGLNETTGANDNYNVFRRDEINVFEDRNALLQNAPEQERGMFKIPKVIQ